MDNLIRVYDNVIDSEYCKKLIDRFESNKQLHQSFDDRGMVFTQINIQKEGWYDDVNILSKVFQDNVDRYKKDCKIEKQQMPMNYILEPIRMKRYLPNNYDEFKNHVDVHSKINCTRFLSMFVYMAVAMVTCRTKTIKSFKIYYAELFTLCLISKIVMFL